MLWTSGASPRLKVPQDEQDPPKAAGDSRSNNSSVLASMAIGLAPTTPSSMIHLQSTRLDLCNGVRKH